jgi:deoxycytidine triphosphate deaminase
MDKERFTKDVIAQIESSAVLSDLGIIYHMQQGKIVIEPFCRENLSTSSYNLTLGEWYFVRAREEPSKLNICDFQDPRTFWDGPHQAILAKDFKVKHGQFTPVDFWKGMKDDDRLIIVPAGEVILVHSREFAGARDGYTQFVRSRSTLERLGVTTTISAGWGDVGFTNRWTFLLKNEHFSSDVVLKVGVSYFQIVFLKCAPVRTSYVERGGRYQETENLEELMKSWTPEDMLPKC